VISTDTCDWQDKDLAKIIFCRLRFPIGYFMLVFPVFLPPNGFWENGIACFMVALQGKKQPIYD
jgi:hypothetical protein